MHLVLKAALLQKYLNGFTLYHLSALTPRSTLYSPSSHRQVIACKQAQAQATPIAKNNKLSTHT